MAFEGSPLGKSEIESRTRNFQELVKHIWEENPNDNVQNIITCMREALICICRIYQDDDTLENESFRGFRYQLIASTTAEFLAQWFLYDKNAWGTINSFANSGYIDHVTALHTHVPPTDSSIAKAQALRRAYKKIIELDRIRLEQAIAEGRHVPKEPDKLGADLPPDKVNSIPIHFSNLWIMDKIITDELALLKLVYERKEFMRVAHEKGRNDSLQEACQKYYHIYRTLIPPTERERLHIRQKDPGLENREYVITSIMMYNLEVENRIHAVIMLAKHINDRHLNVNFEDYEERLLLAWGRCAYADERELQKADSAPVFEYTSYDVLCALAEIVAILENDDFLEICRKKIRLERGMLKLMRDAKAPSSIPSWTEKDYKDARYFFEYSYPLYQIYTQICEKNGEIDLGEVNNKTKSTCYDHIREIYWKFIDTTRKNAFNKESPGLPEIQEALKVVRTSQRHPRKKE